MDSKVFFKAAAKIFFMTLGIAICLLYGLGLLAVSPYIKTALYLVIGGFFFKRGNLLKKEIEKTDFESSVASAKLSKIVYAYRTVGIIIAIYAVLIVSFPVISQIS